MIKRPNRRALSSCGVGALLVLVAITAQAGWLFVLAALAFSFPAASLIAGHRLRNVEVVRSVPVTARVGDAVTVGLELRNVGRRTVPAIRATDRFEAFGATVAFVDAIDPRTSVAGGFTRRARRRGVFERGTVDLECGWPFGMTRSRRALDVAGRMTVVPRSVVLTSFPLLEPSSHPAEALHERARVGAGLDYRGTREYRSGDSPRAVHWRSSARTGRLVVREYEEISRTRVVICLGGGDDGTPPDSSFEALVSAAASIALYTLRTGHPVALVRKGDDGAEILSGPDAPAVLRWLAAARPRDEGIAPLARAGLATATRRATVVLLAPTAGAAGADLPAGVRAVQSGGCRCIVVVARSSSWGSSSKTATVDEGLLLNELGGRGSLRVLTKGDPLERCLQA